MAHPLTQHPPNLLSFGAPSRTPLGFGFGQPSHAYPRSGFGSPSPSPSPSLAASAPAFPSTSQASTSQAPPLRKAFTTPRLPHAHAPTSTPTPAQSLKRARRASSSSSPATSPSPLPSSPLSPRKRLDDLPGPSAAGLGAITLDPARPVRAKRVRAEGAGPRAGTSAHSAAVASASELDAGVLLAALPPTAHLPILLNLLHANPALAAHVLDRLPRPDLADCLKEVDRAAAKVAKAAGGYDALDGLAAARRWARVEAPLAAFCNSASTYVRFFTNPPSGSSATTTTDARTLFTLLHALTSHILSLLRLVPVSAPASSAAPTPSPAPPDSAKPLLDLANLVLADWQRWLAALADEVNVRGGMYPQSTVLAWADGLARLAAHSADNAAPTSAALLPTAAASSFASWGARDVAHDHHQQQQQQHALVDGFRQAIGPIKHRFAADLGWLSGRAF
ncbi:hypothetical protein Q5752_001532 [Cryptotrichosporon argae]